MKYINYFLYFLASLTLNEFCLVRALAVGESGFKPHSDQGSLIAHETDVVYYFNTGRSYFSTWVASIKHTVLSVLGFETELSELKGFIQPLDEHPVHLPASLTSCENSPTSRSCWGEYNTSTNYYLEVPDTGRTVEVWLSAEESICNQDGYARPCLTFNGTMPGPTIVADWGDYLKVHVTNNLPSNGKAH
jgi:hypothetical protein